MIAIHPKKLRYKVEPKVGRYFYGKANGCGFYRLGYIVYVFEDTGTLYVQYAGATFVNQFSSHEQHLWAPKGGQEVMKRTWHANMNKTIKKSAGEKPKKSASGTLE